MGRPIVFMFSGQGSQFFHMGAPLYRSHPPFRRWMDRLDSLFRDVSQISVLRYLYDDQNRRADTFNQLQYSHPALFMVQYALARILMEAGVTPDLVLGTSLGELISATISGVVTLEDAAEMVVRQAQLVETHCRAGEGGMLAVVHEPTLYHRTPLMYQRTDLAGINHEAHFVISGPMQTLTEVQSYLDREDILHQLLPVTFAFHSRWVEPVARPYCSYLRTKQFGTPNRTFVSCVTGEEMSQIPSDYFWEVVRQPIAFQRALGFLERAGRYVYVDLGPSGTLANFVSKGVRTSKDLLAFANDKNRLALNGDAESLCVAAMTPFDSDAQRINRIGSLLESTKAVTAVRERREMRAYLFPGQGSQQQGMGERLFDQFEALTHQADQILGYSVKRMCLENPDGQLTQTQFTQPAIYVVNALSYLQKVRAEPKPDYVLGHSVAEYNALFAAGVVSFETGLRLVKKRGELMAHASGGGMAAVLGLAAEAVERILEGNHYRNLYVANYNSPYQVVISGLKAEIVAAEQAVLNAGATHYRILNVSGAFHTPYMAEAKKQFASFVEGFDFERLAIPVISNVTARPYRQHDIKANLIEQITAPVKWTESIRYLLAMGVNIAEFYEVSGVGISVVKAMALRIASEAGPLDLRETSKYDELLLDEKGSGVTRAVATAPTLREDRVELAAPAAPSNGALARDITAESLGCEEFKRAYGLKYAYLTGGMYRGIASSEMVVRVAKAGMMGFFGTGGLSATEIEAAIKDIQKQLGKGQRFGINLVSNPLAPDSEEEIVDLCLRYGVNTIEAGAYMTITPALVKYRAKGLAKGEAGAPRVLHRIIAKLSRPEVAEQFLSPAPERIVDKLLQTNKITGEESELLASVPMADDLCVEADSGGHTDQGKPFVLMPVMLRLRDDFMRKHQYANRIKVGAAGGIGTPEAAAAAFILGAEFILTGSINQCSVEAGTSDAAKDLLQQINVQDTDYAPAGDMFELGAKVQVVKRGAFFPARANKLYELYRKYDSIDQIDEKTRIQLEERYFRRSLQEVYQEIKSFHSRHEIEHAERNPKHKMALIFRSYLAYGSQLALRGDQDDKVNYQIQCGPALGAFNQWVKGTPLENWRNRHVDEMGRKLMQETAALLTERLRHLTR